MAPGTNPEKGPLSLETADKQPQLVVQPGKAPELASLMETIDVGTVSESAPQKVSEQGGGGGTAGIQLGGDDGASPRDIAIRNLPPQATMQKEIAVHISKEIKNLRREARQYTRLQKPGQAYQLTQLLSRIHRLNGLISQLWDASYDVVKRLFIRIFVDKQTVL